MPSASISVGKRISVLAVVAILLIAIVVLMNSGGSPDKEGTGGGAQSQPSSSLLVEIPSRREVPRLERAELVEEESLEFRVLDADSSAPLAGVECVYRVEQLESSTLTDGAGVARFPNLGVGIVEATRDGYVGVQKRVEADDQSVLLELKPAREIRGMIVDGVGGLAPAGVLVVAWPESRAAIDVLNYLAGESFSGGAECLFAETNAAGEFTLRRANPELSYRVRGVGPGIVTKIESVSARSDESVTLVGGRVFGVVLKFLEEGGARAEVSTAFRGSSGITRSYSAASEVSVAWHTDEWTLLAGMPPDYFEQSPEERYGTLLSWLPFDSQQEVEVAYRWHAFGYEDVRAVATLRPIQWGLQEEVIPVFRTGEQWGSLELNYLFADGVRPLVGGQEHAPARYELQLTRLDSEQTPKSLEIHVDPRKGRERIEQVPAGSYEAKLLFEIGLEYRQLRRVPDSVVTVIPNESTRLKIDLTDLGAVQFVLSDEDVYEYQGPFRGALQFSRHDQSLTSEFRFTGAPYQLVAVPAGEYTIAVDHRATFPALAGAIVESPEFLVNPGRLTTVDCQVGGAVVVRDR